MGRLLRRMWLRRRAKRAIWFLRYMDRLLDANGLPRSKKHQLWRDFQNNPVSRSQVLDQMSAMHGIRIKRPEMKRTLRLMHMELVKSAGREMDMGVRLKALTDAASALYLSACWTTEALPWDIQAEQWGKLRDALGLPKGTAREKGVAPLFAEPLPAGAATPVVIDPAPKAQQEGCNEHQAT